LKQKLSLKVRIPGERKQSDTNNEELPLQEEDIKKNDSKQKVITPPQFENNVNNNILTNSHIGINNAFYLFDPVLTGHKRYRDDIYNFSPNFSGGLKPITPIGTTPLNISGYFMFNNVNNNINNTATPIEEKMILGQTPSVNNIGFYTWVMNGTPVLKNKKNNVILKKTSYQNDSS
jgi:hypothetical protein